MPYDWGWRKRQIGMAFRNAAYLSADTDEVLYNSILNQIGVADQRDICILISIVHDAIMGARREERPTTPLEEFLDWLERKRDGIY